MQAIPLTGDWIRGAVSCETNEEGIRPWRLPWDKLRLFDQGLQTKAGEAAGIRIAWSGAAGPVELEVVPDEQDRLFDLVVDDTPVQTVTLEAGASRCAFQAPQGDKLEIYLPQKAGVVLKALFMDEQANPAPYRGTAKRWIAYGSSITQCATAASPSVTWPAIVARSKGWDLTCLGYGGQCHMEAAVARVIRDLPADLISLCLGINVMSGTLNIRTFRSAVIGVIELIREKHTDIPLVVSSPIYCAYRETTENNVGMTLVKMREEIQEAIAILRAYGDNRLLYIDGLELFGEPFAGYMPDQLHPNAEGYRMMGERMTAELTRLGL